MNGDGGSSAAALETVAMIEAAGGEAIANGANVAKMDEVEAMVAQAVEMGPSRYSWSTTPVSCGTKVLSKWAWTISSWLSMFI